MTEPFEPTVPSHAADPLRRRLALAYGDDPAAAVPRLLDTLEIWDEVPREGPVGIKPNLVVSKPSASGATTDPRVVEALIVALRAHGVEDIVILESSWLGDDTERAFDVCGYRALAARRKVRLVNLEQDEVVSLDAGGFPIRVCKAATTLKYLINVPVLKAHCQTRMTCALKNMKGLIPHSEKRRFHEIGLDEPIARLGLILRPDLTVVDGIVGDLSFEEGGNPVRMNRLFAGRDPVQVDVYAARLMGYSPNDIEHVRIASSLGVGAGDPDDVEIVEINRPDPDAPPIVPGRAAAELLGLIDQRQACSACLGAAVHALNRLPSGRRARLPGPLHLGQGFKGESGPGIGIGTCARGFEHALAGCPPDALAVRRFLESLIR